MKKPVKIVESEAVITKSTKKEDDVERIKIKRLVFPEGVEPAYIRVSRGFTINLGNYESARLDVAYGLPHFVEDREKAFKEADDFVAKKSEEVLNEMRKG